MKDPVLAEMPRAREQRRQYLHSPGEKRNVECLSERGERKVMVDGKWEMGIVKCEMNERGN